MMKMSATYLFIAILSAMSKVNSLQLFGVQWVWPRTVLQLFQRSQNSSMGLFFGCGLMFILLERNNQLFSNMKENPATVVAKTRVKVIP